MRNAYYKHRKLKKATAAIFIAAGILISKGFINQSYAASGGDVSGKTLGYSEITIDVVDADIRDVLSALSVNIGKSIIYLDQPMTVTFRAENTERMQALDLLLKSVDMVYSDIGNVIIAGKHEKMPAAEVIQEQPLIAKLRLNYVNAKVLAEQFDKMGLTLPKIALDTNPNMLWISATPSQLAKANEIKQAIDIPENAEITEPVEFERIDLKYISSDTALSLINGMFDGIKIISGGQDGDDKSRESIKHFYIRANKSTMDEVKKIIKEIDVKDNVKNTIIHPIRLAYVDSGSIKSMAEQAEIDVKILTSEANSQIFWAIGDEKQIDRLYNLISQVDIIQNKAQEVILEKIQLTYLSADKLSKMAEQFSIPVKMYWVDENPMMLMVMGNESDIATFKKVLTQIDIPENKSAETQIASYELKYITADIAKKTSEQLGMSVSVISVETNPSVIWLKGSQKDIEELIELLKKLDIQDNVAAKDDLMIKVFQLVNITAKTAAERIEKLNLNNVKIVVPNYHQYEKYLIAVYNDSMDNMITNAISSVDVAVGKIKAPIDSAEGPNARYEIEARRDLLSVLTDIPVENFKISNNISGDASNPRYVLWLEDTSDNIQKARDMVDSINNP